MKLENLERNLSHPMNCEFQTGGSGVVSLMVSISGSSYNEVVDLSSEPTDEQVQELEAIKSRYVITNFIYKLS